MRREVVHVLKIPGTRKNWCSTAPCGDDFGFDCSHYRLHASHQQIHQLTLVPAFVGNSFGG
ncbi:MAG: hypothetical protein R2860_09120 [Desulfobacterales bacterium]